MELTKACLRCGGTIKKPQNESLKNWHERHKFCSKECDNLSRKGLHLSPHTEFKKGHNLGVPNKSMLGAIPWNKGIKGIHLSPETEFRKGLISPRLGKKYPESSRENHWNWKGGITKDLDRIRKSAEYRTWKLSVLDRDGRICVECGISGVTMDADHIKPFALHPELRLELSNGRTLCRPCHMKTPTYGQRVYRKTISS